MTDPAPTVETAPTWPVIAPRKRRRGRLILLVVLIAVSVAGSMLATLASVVLKPYSIPSGSMENTLKCGDRVVVNRMSYVFGNPARNDVVVFHPPAGIGFDGQPDRSMVAGEDGTSIDENGDVTTAMASVSYVKRVIGLPGDKVEVRNQHAYIDGKKLREPYLHPLPEGAGNAAEANWGPYTVPKGSYLMLGDHRDNAADGRFFGWVPSRNIVGRVFMIYWPPGHFGALPAKEAGGSDASKPDPNCLEAIPGQT